MSLLLLPSVDDYEQQLLALLADDLEGEVRRGRPEGRDGRGEGREGGREEWERR